jgi:hypothetical protein
MHRRAIDGFRAKAGHGVDGVSLKAQKLPRILRERGDFGDEIADVAEDNGVPAVHRLNAPSGVVCLAIRFAHPPRGFELAMSRIRRPFEFVAFAASAGGLLGSGTLYGPP